MGPEEPSASARWRLFAPYWVTLSFRTPHSIFLVALPLAASFCSIRSSGQHNMVTLILSAGAELVGLPSFSPPFRPKGKSNTGRDSQFWCMFIAVRKDENPELLRMFPSKAGIFGGWAGSPENRQQVLSPLYCLGPTGRDCSAPKDDAEHFVIA